MSCYSPARKRDGFIVQTAAVHAFSSKASQFRGQCVGQEFLSHASLSACCLVKTKFGLKSLETTSDHCPVTCVTLLFSRGVVVHGIAVQYKVHEINFSCLLACVVVLSAPLLKLPIVCHCELKLQKKSELNRWKYCSIENQF